MSKAETQRPNRKRKPGSLQPDGYAALSEAQKALAKKHGTPGEFASAVYRAVPYYLSMDEASDAVRKYAAEWSRAA